MYPYVKHILDTLLVILSAVIWLPISGICAALVKISSEGSVIFKQKRIGKNKKPFTLYKFRTMYTEAPSELPTHLLDDPQAYITPIGRFLRKSSLDELPQVFNILQGNISIVGPRPALWNQDDLIAARDQYKANEIRPGLTGLAQVSGRDELSIEKKAELDGEYTKNISFFLDIKIIFLTFLQVFRATGVVEGAKNPSEEYVEEK